MHVVVPGALPYVFTGLQISVGVAWFSLVAGEMVSGEFGLGYVINTSYTNVRYPTIVIGMVTLGAVGYATSALVRLVGERMMRWRARELGTDEARMSSHSPFTRGFPGTQRPRGPRRAGPGRCGPGRGAHCASTMS